MRVRTDSALVVSIAQIPITAAIFFLVVSHMMSNNRDRSRSTIMAAIDPTTPQLPDKRVFEDTAFRKKTIYYIRPSYPILLDKILCFRSSTLEDPPNDRAGLGVLVTGTPSIGKSVFLRYIAKALIQREISFVARIENNDYVYIAECKSDTISETAAETETVKAILKDHSAMHLIDPSGLRKFNESMAFTVFFTSPTITNIEYYHNKRLRRFYIPYGRKASFWTAIHL